MTPDHKNFFLGQKINFAYFWSWASQISFGWTRFRLSPLEREILRVTLSTKKKIFFENGILESKMDLIFHSPGPVCIYQISLIFHSELWLGQKSKNKKNFFFWPRRGRWDLDPCDWKSIGYCIILTYFDDLGSNLVFLKFSTFYPRSKFFLDISDGSATAETIAYLSLESKMNIYIGV